MVLIENVLGALTSLSLFFLLFIEFLNLVKQLYAFLWDCLALAIGLKKGNDL